MRILDLTVIRNPFIPHRPTKKQAEFLLLPHREAFYGGAGGGGKSDALLMAALQYVHVPGYAAILFRKTFSDLSLPNALMDRSAQWLMDTGARWSDKRKTFLFPAGSTLTFGFLESENDKYRYRSSEFQFIGWDELTDFSESSYRFLFSRRRRLKGFPVPVRTRAASNPGGPGHTWVKRRFIDEGKIFNRPYVPARLSDNPFIDQEEYELSLAELDLVTRQQILHGDWFAHPAGNLFKREWFDVVSEAPSGERIVRYWDLAATPPGIPGNIIRMISNRRSREPDWTSGSKLTEKNGIYYIMDVRRVQASPKGVEDLIKQTAAIDTSSVEVFIEQEPGASGKNTIDHYQRQVLKGFAVKGISSSKSKIVRARPLASASEARNVKLIRGPWINTFLDEFEAFPTEGVPDDQVDSTSGAFDTLARQQVPGLFFAGGERGNA